MTREILFKELLKILQGLPINIEAEESQFRLVFLDAFELLYWKEHCVSADRMEFLWKESAHIKIDGRDLVISAEQSWSDFQQIRSIFSRFRELIYAENLVSEDLWPNVANFFPKPFSEQDLPESRKLLEQIYKNGLMVEEKKGLVLDLAFCHGPKLLGIDSGRPGCIDAASQIASLALGMNHPLRRSMLSRPELQNLELPRGEWDAKIAFEQFLHSQLPLSHIRFLNSGAEAMESAVLSCLGAFPDRRKIYVFEGSFHGRTMLALHTTHSPAKREPFEFFSENIKFHPFPECKDPSFDPPDPDQWKSLWSEVNESTFKKLLEEIPDSDSLLSEEIRSLSLLRKSVSTEKPLCVVIEPVQCEGGERFATGRFFRALRLLTRAFDVPLVFDEVQSGFGFGASFLFFQRFKLIDKTGAADHPDAIYLAKKAQVGIVMSRYPIPGEDEAMPASLYRGLLQAEAVMLASSEELETQIREILLHLQKGIGEDVVIAPRNIGIAFAFDLPEARFLNEMIKRRFENGLLFYPAGDRTARFRLTLDVRKEEILKIFIGLFQCIQQVLALDAREPRMTLIDWAESLPEEWTTDLPILESGFRAIFHGIPARDFEAIRAMSSSDWDEAFDLLLRFIPQLLARPATSRYSLNSPPQSVDELIGIYQTDDSFTQLDLLWTCSRFFGSAPKLLSPEEKKTRVDEIRSFLELTGNNINYLDECLIDQNFVTIFQGSFGEIRALSVTQFTDNSMDVHPLIFRVEENDRDILWLRSRAEEIMEARRRNLEFVRQRGGEAFDGEDFCKLQLGFAFEKSQSSLMVSSSAAPPHRIHDVKQPSLLNKVTLSNFVTRSYIYNTQILAEFLPVELRHLYFSSGRAEAIEKSMRLLRYHRKEAKIFLSVKGDRFASSTAAASSLGGDSHRRPRYFSWPTLGSPDDLAKLLSSNNSSRDYFGLYLEPLRKDGTKKDRGILRAYRDVCSENGLPLVFVESNSWGFRYDPNSFLAATSELCPDLVAMFLGGQLGLVATKNDFFLDKPLMMISTWDGDDYSLARVIDQIFEILADQGPKAGLS